MYEHSVYCRARGCLSNRRGCARCSLALAVTTWGRAPCAYWTRRWLQPDERRDIDSALCGERGAAGQVRPIPPIDNSGRCRSLPLPAQSRRVGSGLYGHGPSPGTHPAAGRPDAASTAGCRQQLGGRLRCWVRSCHPAVRAASSVSASGVNDPIRSRSSGESCHCASRPNSCAVRAMALVMRVAQVTAASVCRSTCRGGETVQR